MNEELADSLDYERIKNKLPKLPINKVEEANSFINDPRNTIQGILENRKRKTYKKNMNQISKTHNLLSPIPASILQ